MSISVSTNKDGITSLYINDNLSSVDKIVYNELVVIPGDELITCYGILSNASVGLSNYKNKEWLPEGSKVLLNVHGGKVKQAYNKEAGKYQDTTVSRDELHLYSLLKQESETHGECHLKGFISPWVNPYYWEFSTSPTDAPRAKKINDEIVGLSPIVGTDVLTEAEITAFKATLVAAKKTYGNGSYSKGETETERLAARIVFFTAQMAEICDFKSLYDLSGQLVSIKTGSDKLNADELLESTIAQTIQFVTLILGGK